MHGGRRRLVAYDIRDPKRYRAVHKTLKGYGTAVQFSVFRCHLDDGATAELRWKLEKAMEAEDSLLVIDLCPSCAARVITRNHVDGWDLQPPDFLVVDGSQAPAASGDPRRGKKT
jgi:CRISPR-associated protein Cas2